MKKWIGNALILLLFGVTLATMHTTIAQAATVPGTPVTISGLDALSATANEQAKNGIGRVLALAVALIGMSVVATSYVGTGITIAVAGVAMAFFPGIIDTAFTATAAAPLIPVIGAASIQAWYAPLLAVFYAPLLLWKFIQDPVLLASLASASCGRFLVRLVKNT